jgi:pimeloyl-ACP methyl ester carboxylesterase
MKIDYKKEFIPISHFKNNKEISYKLALHHWGKTDNESKIFCVHGLARNARDFDFLAQNLANNHHVIAVDVVGRGESDWLEDKTLYNYETYVEDFIQIFNRLNLKKVNWVGTSMGGIIGMAIAAKYPTLIDKIVLNDIGTFIPKTALQRIAKYISIVPEFKNFQTAKDFFKVILVNFGIKEEEHWDHIVKYSTKINHSGLLTMNYDPGIAVIFKGINPDDIQDAVLREEWKKVCFNKMLLIHGENSDIFLHEDLQYMLETKNNITPLVLKGVGHAPALVNDYEIKPIYNFFSN